MPIVAADELEVVVLGVNDPGQDQLMLIGLTHAAGRLSPDPLQRRHHDGHNQRNNRNDHQQLYKRKAASPAHDDNSHKKTLSPCGHYNSFIINKTGCLVSLTADTYGTSFADDAD